MNKIIQQSLAVILFIFSVLNAVFSYTQTYYLLCSLLSIGVSAYIVYCPILKQSYKKLMPKGTLINHLYINMALVLLLLHSFIIGLYSLGIMPKEINGMGSLIAVIVLILLIVSQIVSLHKKLNSNHDSLNNY